MTKYRIIAGTSSDGYVYADNLGKSDAEQIKETLSTPSYIEKYDVEE